MGSGPAVRPATVSTLSRAGVAARGFGHSRFRRKCVEQECMDRWPCAVERLLADAGFGRDAFHGECVRAAALCEAQDGGKNAS